MCQKGPEGRDDVEFKVERQTNRACRTPHSRLWYQHQEDMSGEATTGVGPPASFYTVQQHDLTGQPDEPSTVQEVDPALEAKRRKARERQRRKRERDRASSALRAPTGTGTGAEAINDGEAQRAEIKKVKARERQRKHRELVKARRTQETTPLVREPSQSHIVPVEPAQERASVVAPPPAPNPPQGKPLLSLRSESKTLSSPTQPTQHC